MKRILSFVALTALLLALFCACGNSTKVLSAEKAQEFAMDALGIKKSDISEIHTHISGGETPGFSFHITVGEKEYGLFVDAVTGEVSPIEDIEH